MLGEMVKEADIQQTACKMLKLTQSNLVKVIWRTFKRILKEWNNHQARVPPLVEPLGIGRGLSLL